MADPRQDGSPTLRPFGPNAWLIQHPQHDLLVELADALLRTPPQGLIEPVLGYDSLLLHFATNTEEKDLRQFLQQLEFNGKQSTRQRHHIIPVRYDGPDLAVIAEALRLGTDDIIRLHTAPTYRVRFLGFAPGFAYLDGLDAHLHLPRRDSPRTRIDPGSVAIGGSHASIYTVPSPGGWNILGHTDHPLFAPEKNDLSAFTLAAGDSLEFQAIEIT